MITKMSEPFVYGVFETVAPYGVYPGHVLQELHDSRQLHF